MKQGYLKLVSWLALVWVLYLLIMRTSYPFLPLRAAQELAPVLVAGPFFLLMLFFLRRSRTGQLSRRQVWLGSFLLTLFCSLVLWSAFAWSEGAFDGHHSLLELVSIVVWPLTFSVVVACISVFFSWLDERVSRTRQQV